MPTLDELLAGLAQSTAEQKRAKAARKVAKISAAPIGSEPFNPPSQYTDEALCIIVRELQCSCGEIHRSSEPYIYLQQFHPRLGQHWSVLPSISPIHRHLPRRIHTIFQSSAFCESCFSQFESCQAIQPDLFDPANFPEEDDDTPSPVDFQSAMDFLQL